MSQDIFLREFDLADIVSYKGRIDNSMYSILKQVVHKTMVPADCQWVSLAHRSIGYIFSSCETQT